MLYLLDSSSVISVQNTDYSHDCVPEFWEWLQFQFRRGVCKIPPSIFAEIKPSDEKFKNWITSNERSVVFAREENLGLVRKVVAEGYGENLSDVGLEKIGADPFLIASALEDRERRAVVTHEASKPSRMRANRQIPDICNELDIKWMNTVGFIKALNFKTKWKNEASESELDRYSGSYPYDPQLF